MKDSAADNLEYERKYLESGYKFIAGVDEVGRGPLAGPVVTCAVIMPLDKDDIIEGVTDSKKLSEKKRRYLAEKIKEKAIAYKITEISPKEIDEINILEATKKSMYNSINGLKVTPDVAFIDALKIGSGILEVPIIKGDFLSYSIGCASIVAKVYRDDLMVSLDDKYPQYGFKKHKGYGTKVHVDAIKEFGPCEIHRKTFIKNFWVQKESE